MDLKNNQNTSYNKRMTHGTQHTCTQSSPAVVAERISIVALADVSPVVHHSEGFQLVFSLHAHEGIAVEDHVAWCIVTKKLKRTCLIWLLLLIITTSVVLGKSYQGIFDALQRDLELHNLNVEQGLREALYIDGVVPLAVLESIGFWARRGKLGDVTSTELVRELAEVGAPARDRVRVDQSCT